MGSILRIQNKNSCFFVYPGFILTVPGIIIGAAYGFLDVYVGIYIINGVYSKVAGK